MAFDSLSLSVLTKELSESLTGGKITKINQPERDEIVLTVFANKTRRLVMSANPSINRLHFTDHVKENPAVAPNFCMLLRKHLLNATFISVEQKPFERVVDFTLASKNELGYSETKHLIFELTGKTANIILTDENYTIFDTLKHLPMGLDAERIILAGAKYEFFADRGKIRPDDTDKIYGLLCNSNRDFYTLLTENLLGVSTQTVSEMLYGISYDATQANVTEAINGVKEYLKNLDSPKPNVVFASDNPIDVFPFDYRSVKGEKKFFDTLNQAHDEFYFLKDRTLRSSQKRKHLSAVIKNAVNRIEKKIAIQTQALSDSGESEKYMRYGDLILANIHCVKPNASVLSAVDYYDEKCPVIEIALNPMLSAQKNAQEYYKKYRKMKNTVEITQKLLLENKEQLEYVLGMAEFLKFCSTESDLVEMQNELTEAKIIKDKSKEKRKQPPVSFARYRINGFSVLVGKNNTQNDFLTFKTAKPWDMWLHTQTIHSAHVLIETEQKDIPDDVLLAAAEITAFYSPARNSGKTTVDYTLRKNLKKPPKSALGYAIYTIYNTLIVKPNEHTEFLV